MICMVTIRNDNREDGLQSIDLGNYVEDEHGRKCLVTSRKMAQKYGHLVNVPIYVFSDQEDDHDR